MNKLQTKEEQELENKMYNEIKELIESSKRKAYIAVNTTLLDLYWHIGENIVNNVQKGKKRAKYGDKLIDIIAIKLTYDYGRNFSARNLRYMRKFYFYFPIWNAVSSNLNWTYYKILIRVKDEKIKNYARMY